MALRGAPGRPGVPGTLEGAPGRSGVPQDARGCPGRSGVPRDARRFPRSAPVGGMYIVNSRGMHRMRVMDDVCTYQRLDATCLETTPALCVDFKIFFSQI